MFCLYLSKLKSLPSENYPSSTGAAFLFSRIHKNIERTDFKNAAITYHQ